MTPQPDIVDGVPTCSARCPAMRVVPEVTGTRFQCGVDPHGMGGAPLGDVCKPDVRALRARLVVASLDYGNPTR